MGAEGPHKSEGSGDGWRSSRVQGQMNLIVDIAKNSLSLSILNKFWSGSLIKNSRHPHPQENLKSRVSQMLFPAFSGVIWSGLAEVDHFFLTACLLYNFTFSLGGLTKPPLDPPQISHQKDNHNWEQKTFIKSTFAVSSSFTLSSYPPPSLSLPYALLCLPSSLPSLTLCLPSPHPPPSLSSPSAFSSLTLPPCVPLPSSIHSFQFSRSIPLFFPSSLPPYI